MELSQLLPSYVRYQRMGHNTILGYAESLGNNLVIITTAAMDPEIKSPDGAFGTRRIFKGSAEKREIVEIGGPAYYGMALLTDEEGRAALLASRHFEYDYSTEADEVPQIEQRDLFDESVELEPDEMPM